MKTCEHELTQQLPFLLPSQDDIEVVRNQSSWDNQFGEDCYPKYEKAVRRMMDGIINKPTDPDLWLELSHAVGSHHDLAWKFAFVAYRLAPHNDIYTERLKVTTNVIIGNSLQ